MPFDLIAYGMLMAGLGFAVGRFAPELQSLAWLAGFSGLFIGWAGAAVSWKRKRFPMLTGGALFLVSAAAGKLALDAWHLRSQEAAGGRIGFAVAGLMLFLSLAQAILGMAENRSEPSEN